MARLGDRDMITTKLRTPPSRNEDVPSMNKHRSVQKIAPNVNHDMRKVRGMLGHWLALVTANTILPSRAGTSAAAHFGARWK